MRWLREVGCVRGLRGPRLREHGCVRGCVRGSDFLSSADPRISGGCTINTPMPIYKERGKPSNNLHYLKLVLGNKSGQYIFFLHCTLRSHSCESSIGSMRPSLLLLCICIVSVAAWANRSNSSAGANGTISTDDNAAGGNSSGGGGGGDVLWMHLASSTAATVPTGPRLRPTATLDRYALLEQQVGLDFPNHKRHKSETSHKITRHVIDLESAE